jgi:hypothetical protein
MREVKICPSCGHKNPAGMLIDCEKCHTSIDGVDLVPDIAETPAEPPSHSEMPQPTVQHDSSSGTCPDADCLGNLCNGARHGRCELLGTVGVIQIASVLWPWGEEALSASLQVGRDPPAPEALRNRLEANYVSVSRRHATLDADSNGIFVTDLGSRFGTYLNGQSLLPNQRTRLNNDDELRFGEKLTARIRIR